MYCYCRFGEYSAAYHYGECKIGLLVKTFANNAIKTESYSYIRTTMQR